VYDPEDYEEELGILKTVSRDSATR